MLEEKKIRKINTIRRKIDSDSYKYHRRVVSDKYSSNIDYLVDRVLAKHGKISRNSRTIGRRLPWKQILGVILALFIILAAVPYVLPPLYGDFDSDIVVILDPNSVRLNETLFVNVSIPSSYNITLMRVDMAGIVTIDLSLVDNTSVLHLWSGVWVVHDATPGEYIITITALDIDNMSYSAGTRLSVLPDEIPDNESSDFDKNETIVPTGLNLSFNSDKDFYLENESVLLSGIVLYNDSLINTTVDLLIIGSDYNSSISLNVTEGRFNYLFIPIIVDSYVVQAFISYLNETIQEEIKFVVSEVVSNVSVVSIEGAKEHEQVYVLPGTSFYVERVINGTQGLEAVFAPLFSDGLTIEKFEIINENKSAGEKLLLGRDISPQVFSAGKGASIVERRIDSLRESLPVDVKQLSHVSYSKSFSLDGPVIVRIWFKTPSWEEIKSGRKPSSGKISYLTFSNDESDGFDFEGSTWWNSNWGNRKLITINSSQIDADLTNFPILVNITDIDLRDKAQNDGDDIAFVLYSDNTTKLNHEIELYNGSTGELFAWVNITSLSSSSDSKIWMYYNNSGSSNQQNPIGVWDSNYTGVWHLNDLVTDEATSGTHIDSTVNGNNGSQNNNDDVLGLIGRAQDFDGDDYINITSTSSLEFTTAITLSGWIRLRTFGAGSDVDPILRKGEANPNNYELMIDDNLPQFILNSGDGDPEIGTNALIANTWYYIVGTWESGGSRIVYRNGVQDGTGTFTGPIPTDARDLYIGGRAGTDSINGYLDEVRVSNIVRNASWISTTYNTVTNTSTFISIGSEEYNTNTSVNTISPYTVTYSPYGITATGASGLDNVTLYYRYSNDNTSWDNIIWSSELLTNPSFETGDATGWTNGGGGTMTVGTDCPGGSESPYEGTNYSYWLSAGENVNAYAYQNVSLESYASYIDAGQAIINVTGWLVSDQYSGGQQYDYFFMNVKFYNASDENMSGCWYESGGTNPISQASGNYVDDWAMYGITNYNIPTGARKVQVSYFTWHYDGSFYVAGSADNFSVKVGIVDSNWNEFGTDTSPSWSWDFTFPNSTGYYEFYSIGKKSGFSDESAPSSADAICYFNESLNTPPDIALINPQPNGTIDVSPLPICQVWANDSDGDTLTVYWYENTTGSWVLRNTNNSISANSVVSYTFMEFSNYSATYWWKVAINDSIDNTTASFYFTTELISTSVDSITPYNITTSPLAITATGDSVLDNVTLYYRWSQDNITWEMGSGGINWSSELLTNPGFETGDTSGWTNGGGGTMTVGTDCPWGTESPYEGTYYSYWLTAGENVNAYAYQNVSLDSYASYIDAGEAKINVTGWLASDEYNIPVYDEFFMNVRFFNASDENMSGCWYQSGGTNPISQGSGNNVDNWAMYGITNYTIPVGARKVQVSYFSWEYSPPSTWYDAGSADNFSVTVGIEDYNWTEFGTDSNYPWSWGFNFPNGTGYYEFYSIGNKSGSPNEITPDNADAICKFNRLPTITNEGPSNASTGIPLTPQMNITINDTDGETMTITWYSNNSGTWQVFETNASVGNGTYHQTNTNYSSTGKTYWWYVTVTDGLDTNTSAIFHFTTIETAPPQVLTNLSIGVEEANATLWGYLYDDGGESCTVRFEYGTTTSYGTNTTNQTKNTGDEFSDEITSLTSGQLYHYRAYANNTYGSDTGSDTMFLTKPQPPTSLTAQANNSNTIYLTWSVGTGANTTYIERNISSSWSRGEGTEIYNGTAALYEDTGLTQGTTYYYQAWSYTTWTDSSIIYQWSDNNASDSNTTNNEPTSTLISPLNASTDVNPQPICQIWANDTDGDTLTVYWYENSTESWILRQTNTSIEANSTLNWTFTQANAYGTTYWWRVAINDTIDNITAWYYFTTEIINTSVDTISPYTVTSSPFAITATNITPVDNVTLYYRWSKDNSTWGSKQISIFEGFELGTQNTSLWDTYQTAGGDARIQWNYATAHSGSYSCAMDDADTDAGDYALNVIYTNYDFTGASNINIDFWEREWGDEANDAPDSWTGWGNYDVVAFTNDGNTWYEIVSEASLSIGTFTNFQYNISADPDFISPPNSSFAIAFQQYDNYQLTSDGRAWDDIYINFTISDENNGTDWREWSNLYNPDTASPWSWDFDFPNSTGYYEFYSIGKKSGSTDETAPVSADAICVFNREPPTITNEVPSNGSTDIQIIPQMNITINDVDGDIMTLTWYSNSSGSWIEFGKNTSCSNATYHQTNSNFSSYNTTYWWNVTVSDGLDTNTSGTFHFTTLESTLPTVTTNASTGVEETNATLHGWLQDNGSLDTTCGFRFGTSSGSYSDNFTKGIYSSNTEFSNNNGSLTKGQIYFYQAWASNSKGFANGAELTFLTKPDPPSSLTAQTNSSSVIYLTWASGSGANTTYIERNASGITSWDRGEGTEIYNSTGTYYEDTGLTEGITYYYQAWSYANWTYNPTLYQWSDANASANSTTNNLPTQSGEAPPNGSVNIQTTPSLYVICSEVDAEDTLNATWWSNSSGTWQQFGSNNTSFASGTNITQTNSNFSDYSTTYYWSVNLTDGTDWNNETYHFTTITNQAPSVLLNSPANGSGHESSPITLSIDISDPESEEMTIKWYGDGVLLDTDTGLSDGTYTHEWYCGSGIHKWNVTVNESYNNIGSGWRWFAVNYFNDTFNVTSYVSTYTNMTHDGDSNWTVNPSGDGSVVSVERVDFTLSGTTTSTSDLTKGQDYTQCVPFATDQRDSVTSNANSDDYTANCVDVEIWDNSGTAAVRVTRTSGLDDSIITVYVVEFSADINVQQGSVSSITGTGTDVTIASIDQTKAFALFYYRRSSGTVDSHGSAAVRSYFSSDNVLRLNRESIADGDFSGHWYVVEDTDSNWDVQSGTISLTASDTTATDTINSVNMAKTFTIASMETTQIDDDIISGTCRVDLQSSTLVRAIRNEASDTITVSYFAVEFDSSGSENVYRGLLDFSTTDEQLTASHTAVNASFSMAWSPIRFHASSAGGPPGTGSSDNSGSQVKVIINATNDGVVADRDNWGANPTNFSWEVIEWIGATGGNVFYEGNITSVNVTKYSSSTWDKFYAEVNNTVNSTFSIINATTGAVIKSGLNIDGESISDVTDDTIKLFGSFNGSVRLGSWNVSWTTEAPVNNAPTQSGEVPTNDTTNINPIPSLFVVCSDSDASDTLNATWWSNSSGSWVQFASNWTSFASGTNITQTNINFSEDGTTYWWSVNLTDSTDWTNETYHFTTANTSIDIIPSQWDIGATTIGSNNYSTSGNYFNLANNGTVILNIQIKASNATNATTGASWNLTSTPGFDNYSLQYNKSGEVSWTNINRTYDTFITNLGIDSWQTFDLNIFMATTATKSDPLSITVTFRSVAT